MRLFFIIALAMSALAARAADEPPGPTPQDLFEKVADIRVEGATLHYDGFINEVSVVEVERIVKAAHSAAPIRLLVIHSRGGPSDFGIQFGELVRDSKLSVIVDRACMSACANYVALPAAELSVPDGALLGFHGGMPRTFDASGQFLPAHLENLRSHGFSERDIERQLARDKSMYARQQALLESVGVSPAILEDTAFRNGTSSRLVWMFTREVLERCYHVTNIKQYPVLEADEFPDGRSVTKVIRVCPSPAH